MTEQQLRERAEAILRKHYKVFGKTDTAWKAFKESTTYKYAIDAMIDFHKQELQRIGEVVYVPCDRKEAEYFLDNEGDLLPVKKLSLLEVKGVTDR